MSEQLPHLKHQQQGGHGGRTLLTSGNVTFRKDSQRVVRRFGVLKRTDP